MTFDLPSVPHMDEEGLQCFKEAIARTTCYLEYGCGGSTVYAYQAPAVRTIISAESDPGWAEQIRRSLSGGAASLHLVHCDLGPVGDWGTPKDTARIRDFWTYMAAPWKVASTQGLVPDTILIDGRFRVACFLFSLMKARRGTTLLFDDYFAREQYFVVEQFCRIHERRGGMAVFIADNQFAYGDLCAAVARHSIVWD